MSTVGLVASCVYSRESWAVAVSVRCECMESKPLFLSGWSVNLNAPRTYKVPFSPHSHPSVSESSFDSIHSLQTFIVLSTFGMPKQNQRMNQCSASNFHPYRRPSIEGSAETTTQVSHNQPLQLEKMKMGLAKKKRIVIISGAGISTSAGGKCLVYMPGSF